VENRKNTKEGQTHKRKDTHIHAALFRKTARYLKRRKEREPKQVKREKRRVGEYGN
jgi:hypothetical protein